MFSVFFRRFSSFPFLGFCEFLLFHYLVVSLVCGFSCGCAPWVVVLYGVLPPPCLSCSSLEGVLYFSLSMGAVLLVSLVVSFYTFALTTFPVLLCLFVSFLCFSLGVSVSKVWFTHLSPFVFIHPHHCCAYAAVKPGALLLLLPPC